jgi:lipopolysaccharide/colanic/teichoic acid biosynthesis glycosyltransferase
MIYKFYIKRFIDIVVALIGLIAPLIIIVSICLYFSLKGNPFFVQSRPGLNTKIFKIIKFRTMHNLFDGNGKLLPDELRLYGLGKLVRKLSLDEIPQLINVLKGDMSFVGPRPLLVEYLQYYNDEQKKRHLVRPGITGWAQVNGRNSISWEDKFKFDIWYVYNVSFFLDLKILLLTLFKVVKREGISGQDVLTMTKFTGKN